MRVFSRIGMVSALSVAGFVAHAPLRAQSPSAAPALLAAADSREFRIADAAGKYLALHFLAAAKTPRTADFVREYQREAPSAAGVIHGFIRPGDPQAAKSWAAALAVEAPPVFVDPGSALASQLHRSNPALPETIVLGPDGKELFRLTAAHADDYPMFTVFAGRLAEVSTVPGLGDYNLPSGSRLAIEGYDPVAYFVDRKALKGKAELPSTYRGVTYRFASEDHRRHFAADPEKYVPTYGGWCATAMGAKGTKVEIDPTNFRVTSGRLFLFYKGLFSDALKDWNKHEREWEPAADRNWKKLTGEEPRKNR